MYAYPMLVHVFLCLNSWLSNKIVMLSSDNSYNPGNSIVCPELCNGL